MTYWVTAFGLRICSDIDLHGPVCNPGPPDLWLKIRPTVSTVLPAAGVQWGHNLLTGETWAVLPGLARVRATSDSQVFIEAAPGVNDETLRAIAISTALPLALQRKDGLLLEASAIRWRGLGLLLIGKGFCGKSTLAAVMSDVGAELLADSHSLVRLGAEGGLIVDPAFPHVRLWPAQLKFLKSDWPEPQRLRPGLEKLVFLVPDRFAQTSTHIDGLVVLMRGVDDCFRIKRLELNEIFQALACASDRLRTNLPPSAVNSRFQLTARLASLRVSHLLQWPRRGDSIFETRDQLINLAYTLDRRSSN